MKDQISNMLKKARTYEKEALEKKEGSPKQVFHVCAPVGWINDPNGFSEYQGEKHLFFQYYPYDTVWGPMHWGHMKTNDFIKWEHMPVALAPDETYDHFGCFSGSAIEWKGKHVLAYTGVEHVKDENGETKEYQRQCIAIGDGVNYQKIKENPVVTSEMIPEGGSKQDFRDPKIWAEDDTIYMVAGNRSADESGQILLYKTEDLKNWEFVSALDQCKNRYGKMWECPDFFSLDGTQVLIVSPQEVKEKEYEFHAGDNTLYFLGEYEKESHTLKEQAVHRIDSGLDFYAPQTMAAADGRRIMIAWLQSWSASWFTKEDGFCGMMTIPRELHVKNGILYQKPVRELAQYYKNEVVLSDIVLQDTYQKLEALSGRIQDLELIFDGTENAVFEVRLAADEIQYTSVQYDSVHKLLTFDRTCSGVCKETVHKRVVRLLSDPKQVKIRIVMDRYSLELFVNDGEQTMTSIIRTPLECDGVYVKADKKVILHAVKHDICLD